MQGMLPPIIGGSKAPQINRSVSGLSKNTPKSSVFSGAHKKATTSMYRAQHLEQTAATSVSRIGQARQQATTSISRKQHEGARGSIYGDNTSDEQRDESRYNYVRKLIAARKKKEAAAAKKQMTAAAKKAGIAVGKGGSFKSKGFHKDMRKYFGKHRSQFSNLSAEEKKIFESVIKARAKSKTTGSDFNRHDKIKMKSQFKKARLAGKMSKEDERDMRGLIGKMH